MTPQISYKLQYRSMELYVVSRLRDIRKNATMYLLLNSRQSDSEKILQITFFTLCKHKVLPVSVCNSMGTESLAIPAISAPSALRYAVRDDLSAIFKVVHQFQIKRQRTLLPLSRSLSLVFVHKKAKLAIIILREKKWMRYVFKGALVIV